MTKQQLKIVFLGTPEFAVTSLDALVQGGYNICGVVTMPDKIAGRGHKLIQSAVKEYALEAGLPILQPSNLKDTEFITHLQQWNADLFIVIAFRMLPEVVWQMPRLGTFNLHASLLPRYRGAAPINWAVINGDKTTGVTTFFLKHEIDTGDIIEQREIEIADDENVGSVHDRLMQLGAEMVLSTVNEIIDKDGKVNTCPQPVGDFIPAPKIFSNTCIIDWRQPAKKVLNLIRGLSPYPTARTTITNDSGKEYSLKIYSAHLVDNPKLKNCRPGVISSDNKSLTVQCADIPIQIDELQLQGKKRMSTADFLLGFHPTKIISAEK